VCQRGGSQAPDPRTPPAHWGQPTSTVEDFAHLANERVRGKRLLQEGRLAFEDSEVGVSSARAAGLAVIRIVL
jgi:hypothetical protein